MEQEQEQELKVLVKQLELVVKQDVLERINKIEEEIKDKNPKKEEKEEKRKDLWDILGCLGPIIISAAVGYSGYKISERQELDTSSINSKNYEIASLNADTLKKQMTVQQALAVSNFSSTLLSSDPQKRKLGIAEVKMALAPEQAVPILRAIEESDSDEQVRVKAQQALADVLREGDTTIESMFSDDVKIRSSAYTVLAGLNSTSIKLLVPEICRVTLQHIKSTSNEKGHLDVQQGIIDALSLLGGPLVKTSDLKENSANIDILLISVLDWNKKSGPKSIRGWSERKQKSIPEFCDRLRKKISS